MRRLDSAARACGTTLGTAYRACWPLGGSGRVARPTATTRRPCSSRGQVSSRNHCMMSLSSSVAMRSGRPLASGRRVTRTPSPQPARIRPSTSHRRPSAASPTRLPCCCTPCSSRSCRMTKRWRRAVPRLRTRSCPPSLMPTCAASVGPRASPSRTRRTKRCCRADGVPLGRTGVRSTRPWGRSPACGSLALATTRHRPARWRRAASTRCCASLATACMRQRASRAALTSADRARATLGTMRLLATHSSAPTRWAWAARARWGFAAPWRRTTPPATASSPTCLEN
mmetsp:Transcript_41964/g.111305  ORF Transcript_41964/g.111305 Transcript_41964/m.111305 type:complete len:285 (+) Transcript_41964:116-970(+)